MTDAAALYIGFAFEGRHDASPRAVPSSANGQLCAAYSSDEDRGDDLGIFTYLPIIPHTWVVGSATYERSLKLVMKSRVPPGLGT